MMGNQSSDGTLQNSTCSKQFNRQIKWFSQRARTGISRDCQRESVNKTEAVNVYDCFHRPADYEKMSFWPAKGNRSHQIS